MQTLTEKVFLAAPPGGLFDQTVVQNLFPESSEGARKALVHRAVAAGEVLRLLPGVFCLGEVYRRSLLHPFALASVLHHPSHVSLETSLWHHGLIPEAVREVACVTVSRTRTFSTPLGVFSYLRVPAGRPRAGVEALEMGQGAWAFVATPLRAIADLVYSRRAISWRRDGLRFLGESLRIDLDELGAASKREDADDILSSIRNERTRTYLQGVCQELWP